MTLPPNVVVKTILVTDLSQELKKQRDFLRWMVRKYTKLEQLDVAGAFDKGAQLFDDVRRDLLEGLFDHELEELLIPSPPAAGSGARALLEQLIAGGRELVDHDHDRRGEPREVYHTDETPAARSVPQFERIPPTAEEKN